MAFASMMFVVAAAIGIFLGVLLVLGLTFLIVGIVRKCNPKNKGKKSPVVCIVIGSVLLFLPVITALILFVSGMASAVFTNINRASYDNITDKWRNEWVSDNSAAEEGIAALLTAADGGDREAFAKLFTPNIQRGHGFDAELEAFFVSYPAGLAQCELAHGGMASSGSYDYGSNVKKASISYTCTLNDKWYSIHMEFCHDNTDSPDDVGIEYFYVENLEAYALDMSYSEEMHLSCRIVGEEEVTARLIGDKGFIFKPTPQRVITEAQMREYLKKYDDLEDLENEIGEPNVSKKYESSTGCEHYYELVPENGEPRYAHICAGYPSGEIYYGYICSDTETLYDKPQLVEED